jgi:CubicO group peptidase (beta-lactamase class C family)
MGILLSELVRRITGQNLATFLQTEIATPLKLDYYFGVPQDALARCAEAVFPPSRGKAEPGSVAAKVGMLWPPGLDYNSSAYRMAEMPSNNGHGNARAITRLYAALATGGSLDGITVLKPESIAQMTTEQHHMPEIILKRQYHQASGMLLNSPPVAYMGPNPRAFGHHGSGGPIGFADTDARLSFGYAINKYSDKPEIGARRDGLIDTAYGCL